MRIRPLNPDQKDVSCSRCQEDVPSGEAFMDVDNGRLYCGPCKSATINEFACKEEYSRKDMNFHGYHRLSGETFHQACNVCSNNGERNVL